PVDAFSEPQPEQEPNNSIYQAQSIDHLFSINSVDQANENVEFSTRIPYVSIKDYEANSEQASVDYYSFEVKTAGTRVIVDIDESFSFENFSFVDTAVALFNEQGNLLASNDNARNFLGGEGSYSFQNDSYLTHVFSDPGTYFIAVGASQGIDNISGTADLAPISSSNTYTLQVSLDTPRVTTSIINTNPASGLFARSEGSGAAGNVTVDTPQLSIQNGAQISTLTRSASGGDIRLQGLESLQVSNGSEISASTQIGLAGNISLNPNSNPANSVRMSDNSRLEAQATGEGGNAGKIRLNTQQLRLENEGKVSAANISGESQGISLQGLQTLELFNGSEISASTQRGQAGSVTVNEGENPVESVSLNNSRLSVEATGERGKAGGVTINTEQLSLSARSQLSASNISGESQDIILQGLENIQLTDNSEIAASTQTGTAGSLSINAGENPVDSVSVSNSRLSVEATGEGGKAGGVTVNTQQLTLSENSQLSASNISGESQDIILQGLENVQLTNNSEISASTQTGTAGSLNINAGENPVESVFLSNSRLSVEATGERGKAGGLTVNTQQLTLSENSQLSASNISGESQDITLQGVENLQLTNNSEISASTQTGTAGSLNINAGENPVESVSLNNSRLSVAATGEGGKAGDLTVNTRQMFVRDGSTVTVSSPFGQAGDLTITADSLRLNRGRILAETGTSDAEGGANINLKDLEFLLLDNESLISANALEDANGGNVTIDATFIVATPPTGQNGSDITANAVRGNGGRVSVTTRKLFDIDFRDQLTPENDITVSSEFGIVGQYEFNQVGFDSSRGITELPSTLVDPTGQINRSCAVVTENGVNSFIVTGRGGLPLSPDEVLPPDTVVEDLGTLVSHPGTSAQPDAGTMDNLSLSNPQPPKQIIEAQGWIKTADGQIILVAEVPPTNYQGNWHNPTHCVATDE
ncbi:MAG: pre-peptidase C-terminal domain-containing protein, partial [Coleofasciculus sp. C2-GNP5-27]